MALSDYMLDNAYLQKRSGRTAMGGASYSFITPGTLIQCRATQMSRSESQAYDANGQQRMWKLISLTDPGWENDDRIQITKQGGAATDFYVEVQWTGVQTKNGEISHYKCQGKELTARRDH